MKIIHCADLHLDSSMRTGLSKEKADQRRSELLQRFSELVRYAGEQEVPHILIAGDLFDVRRATATASNLVYDTVTAHPEITFYYLRGNHDADGFWGERAIPENLKTFGREWTTYALSDRVKLTGAEIEAGNVSVLMHSLLPEYEDINLVTLHGQISEYEDARGGETIPLSALRGRDIDYLALGHVHRYIRETLDARGIYCYPGCLEGRGFDECGVHGFVLLEIDEEQRQIRDTFVPFAGRRLHEITADVTGCDTTYTVLEKVRAAISEAGCRPEDLLKIVLTGSQDVEAERNTDYILTQLSDEYFFVKLTDRSARSVNPEEFAMDATLKGEFVRMVLADENLTEERKGEIISCGLKVLRGEQP